MQSLYTIFANWKDMVNEFNLDKDDVCLMSESWNDYTDSACKDGEINDLQYHHCPAWDDMTFFSKNDDFDFICDELDIDPSNFARDSEDIRAALDDGEPMPEEYKGYPAKTISDLLEIYDEL